MSTPRALMAALLLTGCGAATPPPRTPTAAATPPPAPPAPPATRPAPEKVETDTPRVTSAGSAFTVPAGWSIETEGARAILTAPEPDLRVALVETEAKSADEAVAAAWPALVPGFKRPLRLARSQPARNGWEAARSYAYETSPDEKLVVGASALRHGDHWLVVLVRGAQGTVEKRLASLRLFSDSLRPESYKKESFAGKQAHALDAKRIREITDFVEKARVELDVPGVALSLVQGGKVVFAGGFGVRELGKRAKVDANTLFMIASNTKALSTLLLATEVDEGKFKWDTPVTKVYPGFKLGDAATTREVLMKHLVCACTGLPRQDLEWLFESEHQTPESLLTLVGTFQPTTKFGETFQYSNLLASAAGYIGGHVAYPKKKLGPAYDLAMKRRIFAPLGMRATTFDMARALSADHAAPHSPDVAGKMVVAALDIDRGVGPARPAGGAWSSVRDLTRYVQMELAKGKLANGSRMVSEQALAARTAPQVPLGEDATYGMGLMVDARYGVRVVHHGGDLVGYHSDMFWLPEYGVGGVILTNADGGSALRGPLMRKVLEVLFDGKPEADENVASTAKTLKAALAKERERLVVPPAADEVAKLAARYHNDALGDLAVRRRGPTVTFDVGAWKSAVATRKNDDGTTSFVTITPGILGFDFLIDQRDGKPVLVVRDAQHEYVFTAVSKP